MAVFIRHATCPAGYYCPMATKQSTIRQCGGVDVFCPEGSSQPTTVSVGFYTVAGNISSTVTADSQTICPRGYYCKGGRKFPCIAGTFGGVEGLHDEKCSGICQVGHYCPQASTSATEVPCPSGKYGNTRGLQDDNCSGKCLSSYYCPRGSVNPFAHPL